MNSKLTALVTGANKGIGLAIVEELAVRGYEVWLGSRDKDRGMKAVESLRARNLEVKLLLIDVSDESSVQSAFASLSAEINKLDVLINNAGIILDPTALPSRSKMKDIKEVFEVNVFGAIRVTQRFLPLLKASENANVVMMSSGLGSLTLINDSSSIYSTANLLAYNSSKTALNAVTVSFSKEFRAYGIKVNAVEPGNVATDLNGNTGVKTTKEGAVSAVKLAILGPDGPSGQFFGSEGSQPW